jgi:hypothetical protein
MQECPMIRSAELAAMAAVAVAALLAQIAVAEAQ